MKVPPNKEEMYARQKATGGYVGCVRVELPIFVFKFHQNTNPAIHLSGSNTADACVTHCKLSSFDSEREYNLGVLYMTGRGFGMLSNSKEAMRWLKRASLHRHCDAMHALAWSLLQQQSLQKIHHVEDDSLQLILKQIQYFCLT